MTHSRDDLPPSPPSRPVTDSVAASRDFLVARSLKRELLSELRAGWDENNPPSPEHLLARWPGDAEGDPDVASLLFEDFNQRRQKGQPASPDDYEKRFPSQQRSLVGLSLRQNVFRSLSGDSAECGRFLALPSIGDEVFGFRMRHELGQGSFAKVYLAEQQALAGRPVVVKVSAIEGDEPQTLAQLQHTHIVPIYSVHEDAAAGLRAVCMPYFGGASLSRVLHALWDGPEPPVEGSQLVQTLAMVSGPTREPAAEQNPGGAAVPANASPLALLGRQSYVRACAWITARLAEALQHAHQRGVLHRDIKPSNILLDADGQPMLLDFNLAHRISGDHAQAIATLGGTVAYMAPEHLRALASRDPALVRQVDQRADVYGLGMVLYEMLTGARPFDQSGSYSPMPALIEAMAVERSRNVPSLRRRRPDVPWSLESIARTCLASDPKRRYQQAEQLAEDLRCFLEDRPLKFAPELSWVERGQKWVRRHPRLASAGVVALVAGTLLAGGTSIVAGLHEQLQAARSSLQDAEGAEARESQRAFQQGAERARCLVNTTADAQEFIEEGRTVCERTLELYGILDHDDWQKSPAWQRLEPHEQRALSEEVREVLLLLAWARVVAAPKPTAGPIPRDRTDALQQALALLNKAETVGGLESVRAIWEDRAYYLEQLGDKAEARAARDKASAFPPASARDRDMLATTYARAGHFPEALAELNQALALNPRHYWACFHRGMCHKELDDLILAVRDFSDCITLWPEFAWGYFYRGRILHQAGKTLEALRDFDAALGRDPSFALAYVNRALVYLDTRQFLPALHDCDAAVAHGRDDAVVQTSRGTALEGLKRFEEADAAFARARKLGPDDPLVLLGFGNAVHRRRPQDARAAFLQVLRRDPRNLRGLYGCAMLAAEQARNSTEALNYFSQALAVNPLFWAARRGRANVLAHRGEWQPACQDIEQCVKAEPDGVTVYAAACVYALMTKKCPDGKVAAEAAQRALELLREAFTQGYGVETAATDDDLVALHGDPRFQELLRQVRKPKTDA